MPSRILPLCSQSLVGNKTRTSEADYIGGKMLNTPILYTAKTLKRRPKAFKNILKKDWKWKMKTMYKQRYLRKQLQSTSAHGECKPWRNRWMVSDRWEWVTVTDENKMKFQCGQCGTPAKRQLLLCFWLCKKRDCLDKANAHFSF